MFSYNRPTTILLFSVLAFECLCIHSTHNADYNPNAYLQSMQATKIRVIGDWKALEDRIKKLQVDVADVNPQDRLKLTQEALADQRDMLQKIQEYVGLPFQLKSCKCLNLTQEEKDSLLGKIADINQLVLNFKNDLNNCQKCSRIVQIDSQATRQQQYLNSMKKALETDCCRLPKELPEMNETPSGQVNLNNSIFITNTAAPNWIYGNVTDKQYDLLRFALLAKHNVTKCPPDRPFAKSQKQCVNCNPPTPLWDVGRLECTSCGNGQVYDAGSRKCVQKSVPKPVGYVQFISDLAGQNVLAPSKSINSYKEDEENLKKESSQWQTCPKERPFVDRQGNCFNCAGQLNLYNPETRQCTKCPQGTSYIPQLNNCTRNIYVTNPDAPGIVETDRKNIDSIQNQINSKKQSNPTNNVVSCPHDFPYFDGQNCINCFSETPLFNLQTQRCTACPGNLQYNSMTHRCGSYQFMTSPTASNLFLSGQSLRSYQDAYNKRKKDNPGLIDCPKEKPFFNGNQCVGCPSDMPIFDMVKLKCARCPETTTFDQDRNNCVNKNMVVPPTVQRALMNIK